MNKKTKTLKSEKKTEEIIQEIIKNENDINYHENVGKDMSPNDILNVIQKLQEKNNKEIWHEFKLPSNGKAGYKPLIKIRELKTEDEKNLIKELYGNRDKAITNLMKKCVDAGPLAIEDLTTFDQSFVLIELSAITFPGEKTYEIEDEEGNKIEIKVNRDELDLVEVKEEVPFILELPESKLKWHLNFLTVKNVSEIDKVTKEFQGDMVQRMLITIGKITNKVEFIDNGEVIEISNWYDYVRLLNSLKPYELKMLSECLNDKIMGKYGYKLTKEIHSPHTLSTQVVEIDPLNFFRLSI